MEQAISTESPAAAAGRDASVERVGVARPSVALAAATLWQREMVRFFRQRNRVIGALATPIVFWLLLGSGLDRVFTPAPGSFEAAPGSYDAGGAGAGEIAASASGYLTYLFPGTISMIVLFTAIFSTISVIEDRREGFLQSVLVAPVSRLAIVLGKVLGGASIATLQGVLFLLLWPLVAGWDAVPAAERLALTVGVIFVLGMGLTALGLCIAWPMDSTAGFHAIMNLLLLPMWFLCGAVFPVATAPLWLQSVMYVNPLTYGQATLSGLLVGGNPTGLAVGPAAAVAVMLAFVAAAIGGAVAVARRG
jgi:ABC-2 type transport system permease protein